MDFQRNRAGKSRWLGRIVLATLMVAAVVAGNWGISRWLPDMPTVDSRTVVFDTVQQGEFLHEVRCVGRLVSTQQHERPARTTARVKRIVELPGVKVTANTLLVELVNPDLELAVFESTSKLAEAKATLTTEEAKFENVWGELNAAWLKLESDHAVAQAEYDVSLALWKKNAFSEQELRYREINAEGLRKQRDLAREAYDRYGQSRADHLAVFREKITQADTNLAHAKSLEESLNIYAEVEGVLAQVPVTAGEQLEPGQMVAKIVNPKALKAELRVAEVEARYLKEGQQAKVDTRHGVIRGTVSRVEPEVKDGAVVIDVVFDDMGLPEEARPDLSVTALVEVKQLANVIFVGLPAAALADGKGEIYRCLAEENDREHAVLQAVEYGLASANKIVVRSGLDPGDRVILSDLSKFDDAPKILIRQR